MNFCGGGKRAKIPLKTLQCKKEDGGLGLVDIRAKHKSLLFNWICDCKRFQNIKNLAHYHLGEYVSNEIIWQFNLNAQDSERCFPGTSFWHKLLHAWHSYSHREPQGQNTVREEVVWYNSFIKIGGNPVKPLPGSEMISLK